MIISHLDAWGTDPEPDSEEPGPLACTEHVAIYLEEMNHLGAFDGKLEKSHVLRYCHHRGYLQRPLFEVADVLESLEEQFALTRSGLLDPIPNDEREWEKLRWSGRIPSYVADCPRRVWKMVKLKGNTFPFRPPCDSFMCERRCARTRAEDNLRWACRVFPRCDRVWVAVVPDEDSLPERLRQRRCRAGSGGCLWVRRLDNRFYIFSSLDLAKSREEPTSGVWMSASDALDLLVRETLALPGVSGLRWLGTWKRPGRQRGTGTTYDLGPAPESLMEDAVAQAQEALTQQYGADALESMSPEQVETIWLPLLKGEIARQWDIRKQGGGTNLGT